MHPFIHTPDPTAEYETPERCLILKIWDDDRDCSVSVVRATVKPGVTTQPHRLQGVDERYIVMLGTGMVTVSEMAPEKVGPGAVVIIPAGTAQQISNTGDTDLVFYCICTPRFSPESYELLE